MAADALELLRSWWGNYRDVRDEHGFNFFRSAEKWHAHAVQRSLRKNISIDQAQRDQVIESTASTIAASLYGLLAGKDWIHNRAALDGLQKIVQASLRTVALDARNGARSPAQSEAVGEGLLARQAMAAAILIGVNGLDEAVELVRRVPDLVEVSQERARDWAQWICQVQDGRRNLSVLSGDAQQEDAFAIAELIDDPDLAMNCLTSLSDAQASHAMTLLGREWEHHEQAQRLAADSLYLDLEHLAGPVASTAVLTCPPMAGLLAVACQHAPATPAALETITDALPDRSAMLAITRGVVIQRRIAALAPDTDPVVTARWGYLAGTAYAQAGWLAEALGAADRAVAIRRDLAATSPERYRPVYAAALDSLGLRLRENGRPQDALRASDEATAIYRGLASSDPARYRADLAGSARNLSTHLAELGRAADALPLCRESVVIYQELSAVGDKSRLQHSFALALTNLSIRLKDLGEYDEALEHANRAANICHEPRSFTGWTAWPDGLVR